MKQEQNLCNYKKGFQSAAGCLATQNEALNGGHDHIRGYAADEEKRDEKESERYVSGSLTQGNIFSRRRGHPGIIAGSPGQWSPFGGVESKCLLGSISIYLGFCCCG